MKKLTLFAVLTASGFTFAGCRSEREDVGRSAGTEVTSRDEGTGGGARAGQTAPIGSDTAHQMQSPSSVGGAGMSRPSAGVPEGVGEDVPNDEPGLPSAVGIGGSGPMTDGGGMAPDGGMATDGGMAPDGGTRGGKNKPRTR